MAFPLLVTKIGCGICAMALVAGLGVCLMQNPAAQAARLAAAGQGYYSQAYAAGLSGTASAYLLEMSTRTLAQAVSKDPLNPAYWSQLTAALRARGAERQADLALAISRKLSGAGSADESAPAPVDLAFLPGAYGPAGR